jgi:hypothetical protein
MRAICFLKGFAAFGRNRITGGTNVKPCAPASEEFSIDKKAMDLIFKKKAAQDRLFFLGCFLAYLKSSQAKMMMEQQRFPFMFDWRGRLKTIVDRCNQAKTATQTKK